jgi:hypothetical protein
VADFPDVQVGKVYEITDGFGEGLVGPCEDKKETGFGHKFGLVCGYWKRTKDLRSVDGDRSPDSQEADL